MPKKLPGNDVSLIQKFIKLSPILFSKADSECDQTHSFAQSCAEFAKEQFHF